MKRVFGHLKSKRLTHSHAHTHAHACMHARTHTHTHAQTRTRTHTHAHTTLWLQTSGLCWLRVVPCLPCVLLSQSTRYICGQKQEMLVFIPVNPSRSAVQVNPGGVGDRCGLKAGDAVLSINDKPSDELEHEAAKYEILRSGNQVSMLIQR